jgi:hypothetical protein
MNYVARNIRNGILLTAILSANAWAQSAGVLTLSDVIELSKMTEFTSAAKISYVSKRCVDFKIDAAVAKQLQAGGVKGELLTAVRAACYTPPAKEEVAEAPEKPSPANAKGSSTKAAKKPYQPSEFEQEAMKRAMQDPATQKTMATVADITAKAEKAHGLATEFQRRMDEADAKAAEHAEAVEEARQPAIAARAMRLKSKKADVVGFEKPIRVGTPMASLPAHGIIVDTVGLTLISAATMKPVLGGKAFVSIEADRVEKCMKTGSCIGKRTMASPQGSADNFAQPAAAGVYTFHFHLSRESTEKLKVEGVTCTHYAPDGSIIARNTGVLDFGKSNGQWFASSIASKKQPFGPGAYGIECTKDGVPFINTTYDLK